MSSSYELNNLDSNYSNNNNNKNLIKSTTSTNKKSSSNSSTNYTNLNERIKNNISNNKSNSSSNNNYLRHYNLINSSNNNNNYSNDSNGLMVNLSNNNNKTATTTTTTNNNSLMPQSIIEQPKRKLSVALSNLIGTNNNNNNSKENNSSYISNNLNGSYLNLNNMSNGIGDDPSNNQNSQRTFWLIKYCLNLNSSKLYMRKFLLKLKQAIFGLFISLIVCFSFVFMTFLLRRTFNQIEFHKIASANSSTMLEEFDNSKYEQSIESDTNNIVISCDLCYFMVWSVTASLVFVYPVFFIVNYLILNNHKTKQQQQKQILVVNTAVDSNSTTTTTTTATPSTTNSNNKEMKLIDIIKESFDLFAVKKNNSNKKKLLNQSSILTQQSSTNNNSSFQNSTSVDNSEANKSQVILCKFKKDFVFKMALITFVWILTGYSFLRAVDLLFCSDLVLLFSVNFSFVYMATWIILHHLFIPLRLLGFILSIAAIIFTYYSEGFVFNLKFLGNFLATMSSAGSAVLMIVWNDTAKTKSNNQRSMYLSLIGLFNILFGWPIILLLYFTGIETMSFSFKSIESASIQILSINETTSSTRSISQFSLFDSDLKNQIITNLIISTLLGFVYIFFIKFGFLFTNEIYIKIGCLFTIPTAVVFDVKMNDLSVVDLKIGAIISICIGYLFLILPETMYKDLRQHFCPRPEEKNESTYSLSRRYKYSSPASPSPTLIQKQQPKLLMTNK